MYSFGSRSRKELSTVDRRLQKVFNTVIALGLMDISVIQGRRSKEEQNRFYDTGKSKLKWPFSNHNVVREKYLARAIDAAPYVNGKVSWNKNHCIYLAGTVVAVGKMMGYTIRWGGNWDMDGEPITDQDFQDLVHYEIIDINS